MGSLRAALATLEPDATAFDALGMASVATAAWVRRHRDDVIPSASASPSPSPFPSPSPRASLEPDPESPHASDLLRLMRGEAPSAREAALLDAYLVTVADHGFNASTFAARVAASTGADLASSIVAGVCTLSGPLHGGAPGPVLDMLDAIVTPANAAVFIERELAAGRRIMGMGHRVYRVRDPRAFVLERAVRRFQDSGATADRLRLARAVERAAEEALARRHPDRALRANVEFYTAILLEALGIPRAAFTAIFACSRCLGYAAHYKEQRATGRLIRPSALYVGPAPGKEDPRPATITC
jgi:citrate synthase